MGFNIMDLMNGATRAAVEGVDNYEAITLNLDEIKVTKHNRYSMDDLEELATSILMDGLQEPLIIGRVNGEYLLSGGHRRREALVILQNEGHTEITQNIPCRFKDMTETQFRLSLLIGNTFNRKMTDYDLMNQAADWKEVLTQARKEKLLVLEEGKRVRDYVAAVLGEKPTKIAQLEAINNNATEEVKEQFEKGNMKITNMELKRSLDLIETSGETIKNIVNRSNSLAGYLKYNNIADDEELKEIARNFQDAYMNKDNAGGIAAIDNTVEFKEISQRTPSIPTNQITFLRDNIYRYYGVNDKILTSTLNDTEFISFYENVIEPISVQLSYEFTFKLLTPREIGYGNRIDFVANLLQYATLQTRETIGGGMFDRGALTINEYRELMYYGPVEDGDQRLVSLNYVKVGDQSLYQVGQQNEPPDDTGANDREKRAMQAAARAYMQIMKGG